MIEKMKKVISSRRVALDFDKGYLKKVKMLDGYDFVAEVKSEKQSLIKIECGSENRGGVKRIRIQPQLPYKNKEQKDNENTGF